ncbi:DUF1499 domain-containing protein [Yoonia sp. BS5-3]|uniref:DUF1499 domain-containing protein n=1 Tax=Yoonia phaeophyticola TaxID=3137369 RepID=A0ABZ2V4G7_9RHOB
MLNLVILLGFLLATVVTCVRLSRADLDRWHQHPDIADPGDLHGEGSFHCARRIAAPEAEVLAALKENALATPRTILVAGDVADGMMTFETRSAVMGFPDYTTAAVKDGLLVMHGRLRFGRKDFGVNRARVTGWLDALGPLTEPL